MIGVGSKVVCVESFIGLDLKGRKGLSPKTPCKGEVFVVGGMYIHEPSTYLVLHLVGCPALNIMGIEVGWCAFKFRELEHEQMRSELEYLRSLPLETKCPGERATRKGAGARHLTVYASKLKSNKRSG